MCGVYTESSECAVLLNYVATIAGWQYKVNPSTGSLLVLKATHREPEGPVERVHAGFTTSEEQVASVSAAYRTGPIDA